VSIVPLLHPHLSRNLALLQPANFDEDRRVLNTHVVIDEAGTIRAMYSKIHLFNVDIRGGVRLQETDFTVPGKEITPPVETPIGKVGLSIVSLGVRVS
jgi:predicted amidohydrolase